MLAGTFLYLLSGLALGAASTFANPIEPRAGQEVKVWGAQNGVEVAYEGQGFSSGHLLLDRTPQSFWVRSKIGGVVKQQARCILEGNLPRGTFTENSFSLEGDRLKMLKCGCWNGGVHLKCGIDGVFNDPKKYVLCQKPGQPCRL